MAMNEQEPFDEYRGPRRAGPGRSDRGRMRRGDVRIALLIALLDGPGHGYELIQALETKAEGRWRPSPGSVYPALHLLADQGLITSTEQDGKRVFEITDAGRIEAQERISTQGLPWEESRSEHGDLRQAVHEMHMAAKQVGMTGSPETVTQAIGIVTGARKALYLLLAES
jgi:DNA-binding PadR family transcriptional regulator